MHVPALGAPRLSGRRLVDPYLACLAGAAAVVLGAATVALPAALARMNALRWGLLAMLVAGSWIILVNLILFDWRGQRVALGPDEILVFLALVALPLPFVVLFAVPSMAAYQLKTRRPLLRALSNVSVVTLASGACVSTYLLADLLLPRAVSIVLAIVAYTMTTHLLVSSVFSLREDARVGVVFGERFWIPTILHVTLGVAGSVATLALWDFHPAALAALVPFAYLAREHVRLVSRTEREALVHKRMGETARALVGERDLDAVAQRILAMSGDLFQAGRTTLVLSTEDGERRWTKQFEGGAKADVVMAVALEGRDQEPFGALLVHASRRANADFTEVDRALLQIVGADTSAAVANARALRDLDAARERLVSSRVARPLVRRIVRSLVEETRADSVVLLRLGESLARRADATDLAAYARAYEEMGLGRLRLLASSGSRYEFEGRELFEHAPGSRAVTCHLALGFVTGAVAGVNHGASAKGAEVECESRGDARCRFVVHLRAG